MTMLVVLLVLLTVAFKPLNFHGLHERGGHPFVCWDANPTGGVVGPFRNAM